MEILTIANWFTGLVEAVISFILFETFLRKRKRVPLLLYIIGIVCLCILINVSNIVFTTTILNYGITILLSLSISFLYEGTFRMRILSSLLSFMVAIISEMIIFFSLLFILNQDATFLISNVSYRLLGIILSKTLGIASALFISYRAKKNFELMSSNYWLLFTIVFATVTINMYIFFTILLKGVDNTTRNLILISAICIIMTTIIIIYLYEATFKQQIQMSKHQLEQRQLKDQVRHYSAMMSTQEEIKRLRHDLRNHLLSMYVKVERQEYAQCQQYIKGLLDETEVTDSFELDTGNTVLDAIISAKKNEAEEKNIEFYTEIRVPRNLPIKEEDLCIIFGNALDNAIEACEKVKNNPYIAISIVYDVNSLICRIENSCIEDFNLNTITTKTDIKNHGIGKRNIEKSLEHYDCISNVEHTKNRYVLSIIFMDMDYQS